MSSIFPTNSATYKDTQGKGRIVVRGYTLTADDQGFIEAPADIADEILPHGFVKAQRPAQYQGKR